MADWIDCIDLFSQLWGIERGAVCICDNMALSPQGNHQMDGYGYIWLYRLVYKK